MESYIRGLLSDERNVQLLRCQQRVIPVLAKLALLKDSPEQFVKQHGKLYRWVWQYEQIMEEEGEACFVSNYMKLVDEGVQKEGDLFATPSGWRWMLQLNV